VDHRRLVDRGDRRDRPSYAIWRISRVMNVDAKITEELGAALGRADLHVQAWLASRVWRSGAGCK
jgi:hypothetical protein